MVFLSIKWKKLLEAKPEQLSSVEEYLAQITPREYLVRVKILALIMGLYGVKLRLGPTLVLLGMVGWQNVSTFR